MDSGQTATLESVEWGSGSMVTGALVVESILNEPWTQFLLGDASFMIEGNAQFQVGIAFSYSGDASPEAIKKLFVPGVQLAFGFYEPPDE